MLIHSIFVHALSMPTTRVKDPRPNSRIVSGSPSDGCKNYFENEIVSNLFNLCHTAVVGLAFSTPKRKLSFAMCYGKPPTLHSTNFASYVACNAVA